MSIPAIGAFKLVQTPATHNVSDRLMDAPGFITELNADGAVQDHQISYLATSLQCDEVTAKHKLDEFSNKLKSSLSKSPFQWKGLGTLEFTEDGITFDPAQRDIQILEPVPAERVIRDRLQKSNIDDNNEVLHTLDQIIEAPPRRSKTAVIIGLILILLSITFIAFHFYKNGLKPSSSGNQNKFKIEQSK